MNWPIKWSSLDALDPTEFKRWQEASAASFQESEDVRAVWWDKDPSQAPYRQRHIEQYEDEHRDSMREMSRESARESKMEGSLYGSSMPLLRQGVHIPEGEREDVQSIMREQTGLDEAPYTPRVSKGIASRVDRLRAIGNGQVPSCAALAWVTLCENVQG
jgi:hypothetical protein